VRHGYVVPITIRLRSVTPTPAGIQVQTPWIDRDGISSRLLLRLRPAEISPLSIPSQTSPFSPGYKNHLLIRGKFPKSLAIATNLSVVIPCGGREPSRRRWRTRPSGDGDGALAHLEAAAAHQPARGSSGAPTSRRRRQHIHPATAHQPAGGDGGGTSTRRRGTSTRRRWRRWHNSLTTPPVDTSSDLPGRTTMARI
jgi:hypothetical protein